jgi:hypothetical protein
MQIDETVHGCPDGYRGGLPARQLGHPVSASQIRTTSGQLPLVAAAGGAMERVLSSVVAVADAQPHYSLFGAVSPSYSRTRAIA